MRKKLLSVALIAVLIVSVFPCAAFAENFSYNNYADIIIEVSSQSEHDALVAQINEHRRMSELSYIMSLNRSGAVPSLLDDYGSSLHSLGYTTNTASTSFWYSVFNCSINFTATYNVSTNSYGNEIIDQVYDLDAYAVSGANSVEIRNSQSSIIDQGRTISANYSLRIGIKDSSGNIDYHSDSFHVEFYVNGKSKVY